METNSDDNFISDDNIIDEYINKLYIHLNIVIYLHFLYYYYYYYS